VALLGAAITLLGVVGVVYPAKLIHFVQTTWQSPKGFYLVIVIRVVLGALLLETAAAARFPQVFQIFGVISLAFGLIGPIIGFARLQKFVQWWARRPLGLVRIWSLLAFGWGLFLIYAVF
jgi:hypothetical protein